MKKTFVLSIAFLILGYSSAHSQFEHDDADQNWLVLSTELNKNVLRIGDRLEITYRLTNFSDHPIRFHKDPHKFVRLMSDKAEACPIVSPSQVMEGEFVTLSPKETLQDHMVAILEEGIGYMPKGKLKSDGQEQVQGLLLAFPTFKLFLKPGYGRYRFQPLFQTTLWEHRSNFHYLQIVR